MKLNNSHMKTSDERHMQLFPVIDAAVRKYLMASKYIKKVSLKSADRDSILYDVEWQFELLKPDLLSHYFSVSSTGRTLYLELDIPGYHAYSSPTEVKMDLDIALAHPDRVEQEIKNIVKAIHPIVSKMQKKGNEMQENSIKNWTLMKQAKWTLEANEEAIINRVKDKVRNVARKLAQDPMFDDVAITKIWSEGEGMVWAKMEFTPNPNTELSNNEFNFKPSKMFTTAHIMLNRTLGVKIQVKSYINPINDALEANIAPNNTAWQNFYAKHPFGLEFSFYAPELVAKTAQEKTSKMQENSIKNWTLMKQAKWTLLAKKFPSRGDTIENKYIRFHVYNDSVRVWDLANAGKRGKLVDIFSFTYTSPTLEDSGEIYDWLYDLDEMTYDKALSEAKELEKKYSEFRIGLYESKQKGVEIAPAGFKPFVISTGKFYLKSDWNDFVIKDQVDRFNEPTCIPSIHGGKSDVKALYRWVQDNKSKIENLTFDELMSAIRKAGINSHYYCAVD